MDQKIKKGEIHCFYWIIKDLFIIVDLIIVILILFVAVTARNNQSNLASFNNNKPLHNNNNFSLEAVNVTQSIQCIKR